MQFLPAERFVAIIIATLVILDLCLLQVKDVHLDGPGYAALIGIGALAVTAGQLYRRFRDEPAIALTTTATGLFILFTIAGSVFNYLLLPVQFPVIDPLLASFDTAIGFHWPDLVIWASQHATIGAVLQAVYFSSQAQLIVILLFLGFSGRAQALHRFLLTGVLGGLLAILSWSFLPSFGASSVYDLPPEVLQAQPLAVGPAYGAELVRLGREGVTYLTPANVLGLIGFPSFHTIMALMSVLFLWPFRRLFLAAALLNLVMLPAILIQGGHHLSDVLGGGGVFLVAYLLSGIVLRQGAAATAALTAADEPAGARG